MTAAARVLTALIAVAAGGCRAAPDAPTLVNDFAVWMGGPERITAVRSLILQGEGERALIGQSAQPYGADPVWGVPAWERLLDSTGRLRVRQTRVPPPVWTAAPPPPVDYGLDGTVAYDRTAAGPIVRASARAARLRRIEWLHHPVVLMQAALAPGAHLVHRGVDRGYNIVDLTTAAGDAVSLGFDPAFGQLTVARSAESDPVLGDVVVETAFWLYRDTGGLRLPMRIVSRVDRFPQDDFRIAHVAVNADVGVTVAPTDVRSAAPPPDTPSPHVIVDRLARGVWRLAGETHHSVVVEFADHLVLIEVPVSEARTLAVIAAARALRPRKPLTKAIVTHAHFDHVGGLRAAVSEGLTIVAHHGAEGIVRELVARAHSREPDALQRQPRPLDLELVDYSNQRRFYFGDATGTLHIALTGDHPHSLAMIGALLPRSQMFVQADLFSSEDVSFPVASQLREVTRAELEEWQFGLQRAAGERKLTFPAMPILQVPLHGVPVPEEAFLKVIRSVP